MAQDPWDLGGGGNSFPFDNVGDSVEGMVTNLQQQQARNMDTNEPEFWDPPQNKNPKMLTIVTLQTQLRTGPEDNGERTVPLSGSKNVPGSRMAVVQDAVRGATGATKMQYGAWLKITFSGTEPSSKRNFNHRKLYSAWYRAPEMELDGTSQVAPANQLPATYGQQQAQFTEQVQPGQFQQTQSGANWPTTTGGVPANVNPQTGEITPDNRAAGGTLAGDPITAAAVEAIRKAGMNPDTVFGPGWQQRVTG